MAALKHRLRYYGDDYAESEWGDSEWRDNVIGIIPHEVAVIYGSSRLWSSELLADGSHQCETAETLEALEWTDDTDASYEWDHILYRTADIIYETSGSMLLFASRDSLSHPPPSLRKKFRRLAQQWSHDTVFYSSSHDIVMHWAYQQVIGLGSQVVPLIYKEMIAGRLHWTWALSAILGEDPAADTDSPRDATDVWIRWIEEHHSVDQLSALQ